MASLNNHGGGPPRSFDTLPRAVLDGISEVVASLQDAEARARAISSLVQEIYETMEWVHGPNNDCDELASLRGLVAAALEHEDRMSGVATDRLSA